MPEAKEMETQGNRAQFDRTPAFSVADRYARDSIKSARCGVNERNVTPRGKIKRTRELILLRFPMLRARLVRNFIRARIYTLGPGVFAQRLRASERAEAKTIAATRREI